MADLSINTQNVSASNLAEIRKEYPFGATVLAGQVVYKNASNRWVLFDSDAGSGAGANVDDLRGIALHNGTNGQPAAVAVSDPNFCPGATLANGVAYYGSQNAGNVTADVPAASNYPVFLGLARSTTRMNLNPTASQIAV
jgi:hypothetical protein